MMQEGLTLAVYNVFMKFYIRADDVPLEAITGEFVNGYINQSL